MERHRGRIILREPEEPEWKHGGGGSEYALHFIISNRINESVKLSPQTE